MITVSTDAERLARVRRQEEVERLRRGDQDVGRIRWNRARSIAGVSPVRTAIAGDVVGVAASIRAVGDAGERRAQVALDVDGQRLERRDVEHAAPPIRSGGASNISRLMHQRNAVSVLPLPVGARISVDRPARSPAIPAPAVAWAPRNEWRNHSATAGMKQLERISRWTPHLYFTFAPSAFHAIERKQFVARMMIACPPSIHAELICSPLIHLSIRHLAFSI